MAGRGRSRYKGRSRDAPRRRGPNESQRTTMLNLHKITPFRYSIREIMGAYKVDTAISSAIIANVIAKGSRISISSAKEYVLEQERAALIPKDASNEVCDLLDRFSRYR